MSVVAAPHRTRDPDRPAPSGYAPRRAEETLLHQVVCEQLESFLARARAHDRCVPRFVEREFRRFIDCGVYAHGFLRVHCDACGCDRLVPFSCKARGTCPSCAGRRMADTAAHLVDRVLPEVPVRQWVLTLPFAVRYRLADDAALTSDVLREFVRAIFGSLRRRARGRHGPMRYPHCGAVTFVQRFGDALRLNVHFHTLALDGVYDDEMRFRPLPPPDDADVARVAARVARRLARLLELRGFGSGTDAEEADDLARDQPLLAELYAASIDGRMATGRRAGQRLLRFGDRIDADDLSDPQIPRCATVAGVSVHANVGVPARDRQRLERLCRYVARPPVATERLSRLDDGRLLYRLKRRWRDGTTHVVFEPLEFIAKLAALVPPPRANLVRYHGVLAPCASRRRLVIPSAQPSTETSCQASGYAASAQPESSERPTKPTNDSDRGAAVATASSAALPGHGDRPTTDQAPASTRRPRRYAWAELMQRVFAVDVLECPRCHARPMRILAAIHPPDATRAILDCLGLPSRSPPVAPASVETINTDPVSL